MIYRFLALQHRPAFVCDPKHLTQGQQKVAQPKLGLNLEQHYSESLDHTQRQFHRGSIPPSTDCGSTETKP